MKTFEDLWVELSDKALTRPEGSGTVRELDAGVHVLGKKLGLDGVSTPRFGFSYRPV